MISRRSLYSRVVARDLIVRVVSTSSLLKRIFLYILSYVRAADLKVSKRCTSVCSVPFYAVPLLGPIEVNSIGRNVAHQVE